MGDKVTVYYKIVASEVEVKPAKADKPAKTDKPAKADKKSYCFYKQCSRVRIGTATGIGGVVLRLGRLLHGFYCFIG